MGIMFPMPRGPSASSYLLKAMLVIFFMAFLGRHMPLWPSKSHWSSHSQVHPIENLHQLHLNNFAKKLQGQSKTLQAANREYERRYGRSPPAGFNAWFYLAKSHNFVFIDEFDGIMHAIEALWNIPSSVLHARLDSAWNQPVAGVASFEIKSGKVHCLGTTGTGEFERFLCRRLERCSEMGITLPNVRFLSSTLDEPRVFAPQLDETSASSNETTWYAYAPSEATAELRKACFQSLPSSWSDNEENPSKLRFISNVTESLDFCMHPELFQQHGFLQSPDTLSLTQEVLPIFSSCVTAHFSDIPIPSVYHEWLQDQDTSAGLDPNLELPWDDKRNVLYWSGSTTGIHATADNWRTGHRQRLALSLASSMAGHRNVTLLELGDSGRTPHQVEFARVSHLFDVSIRRIVQCDEPACAAMSTAFPSSNTDPASKAFDHKFVLDIDGNTWSGRYHRSLRSRSCVLKMTMFREAQDDHLEPWVHYVPISKAATELAETMSFFIANPSGQRISQDIAEAGKYAALNYLREIDADLITLRILLELGRVLND